MSDEQPCDPAMRYEPSPKHCEPITAEKPGTKCPRWSAAAAQELLDASEEMDDKRVATRNDLAFVAQRTGGDVWHGYPEAWDKIDGPIKQKWLDEGLVDRRALRRWRTRDHVASAWKEQIND